MLIERGSAPYVFADITGPAGWLPETTTCEVALLAEGADALDGDWHPAAWEGTKVRYLVDSAAWPDGRYMLKVRLTAGGEHVVLTSGRVTIGAATP